MSDPAARQMAAAKDGTMTAGSGGQDISAWIRWLLRLLPAEWRHQLIQIRSHRIVRRRDVAIVMGLSILSVAVEAFGIGMILPLLDFVQEQGDVSVLTSKSRIWVIIERIFNWAGIEVSLLGLIGTIVVLVTLRQIILYAELMFQVQLRIRFARGLMVRVARQIHESQALYIQSLSSGEYANLVSEQVKACSNLVVAYSAAWRQFVTIVIYAALSLAVAPGAALAAGLIVVALVLGINRYVLAARQVGRRIVKAQVGFAASMTQQFLGWRAIKIGDTIEDELRRTDQGAQGVLSLTLLLARITNRAAAVILLAMTLIALGAFYGAIEYLQLSLTIITIFVVILIRLTPVARSIGATRQQIASSGAYLDNIHRVLREATDKREVDSGDLPFPGPRREIAFENVSFHYSGGENGNAALSGVTVSIPAGKLTAIVGPSGAGKSTFVDLLPRLITPGAGRITADGLALDGFTLSSLRRNIAYAPQQAFLFNTSITDNVRYGRPETPMEDVVEACRLAYADEFIRDLPDGYDTIVGESGVRLSGGQRQRIILARTMLSKASLLILDEPTGALDHDSEAKIRAALRNALRDGEATIIIIAHHYSTVRDADFVVVLEEGRLTAADNPDALLASDNWFTRMKRSGMPLASRGDDEREEIGAGAPAESEMPQ